MQLQHNLISKVTSQPAIIEGLLGLRFQTYFQNEDLFIIIILGQCVMYHIQSTMQGSNVAWIIVLGHDDNNNM